MRIHKREMLCNDARREIEQAIADAVKKYDLTSAEELSVVNTVCHNCINSIARYAIREERHGDVNKPGGLE